MEDKDCIKCLRGWWKWIKQKKNVAFLANIVTVIAFLFLLREIRDGNEQTKLYKQQLSSLNEQTELLKNQLFLANYLSIFELGDRCMWNTPHGGDYDAYLFLKRMEVDPINKVIKNSIRNQINRVEKKYKSTDIMVSYADNIPAIWKEGVDPTKGNVWAKIDTVKISNIFCHMKERHLETENIKAAYFMSGITPERLNESGKTWEDIFEMLIWAINNETWCLYGRKMALITYCQLAEKQFPNKVFAFKEATCDWKNRKKEILEKKNKP